MTRQTTQARESTGRATVSHWGNHDAVAYSVNRDSIERVLAELLQSGLQLWVENDELCFRAPKGALTPSVRAHLSERKGQIISVLGRNKKYSLPSGAQKRLWFLEQLEPGKPVYNLPAAYRLTGLLDVPALERSLQEIIRRHEILRTTFAELEGQPFQVIAAEPAVNLTVVDLSHVPQAERDAEARCLMLEDVQQPFNLSRGPLLRTTLLRLSDTSHILLLTMHHAISDEWSIGVFNHELASLYEAFCAGVSPSLPGLPIQYADFALWQRGYLNGDALATQLAYWKQQLGADRPMLELPADHPRPPVKTFRGGHLTCMLPQALSEALTALSRKENSTLFMTLLTAFNVLLYRYTGQIDVIIGSPIANRNQAAIEGLIGFFVNTLVMRTDLSGDPAFREALQRVRETTLGAYANQDVPFEKLVEELRVERDPSYNPLFQIMFSLQNAKQTELSLPGLDVTASYLESETAKFDLLVSLTETEQGLEGVWEYRTDLFDASTIARMMGHFQVLLESIVADPGQHISKLPLLTTAERDQLLGEWNNTAPVYAVDKCLHELFETQVERNPNAVAVTFEGQQLTYRELDRRANQLAHRLSQGGVGPESLVGVCLERSLEMVVALFGILKAGGAYVPLDPGYPPERLSFMIEDFAQANPSAAPILLTQRRLMAQLPFGRAQVLCLDADQDANGSPPDTKPVTAVSLDAPAYVIYTSGSTGKPKGVMITHRAICNHMLWMQMEFPFTATDRVLQKTPFSFDASVWEFYAPLLTGGRLVMARPAGHQDLDYLIRTINEQQITILQLVPSLLQLLVAESEFKTCRSLRRVFCGGEPLTLELQERFFAQLPASLTNLYGPTEATIDSTYFTCSPHRHYRAVPIGRPVSGLRAYILDSALQPVPIGVAGELHIGGVGLARGYLNRPQLTEEKFIPDPFSGEPGARLYKTGDLARYLPDGNIEYLSRLDHQTKVRGFRIELGEVEAMLDQHPVVRDSVVIVREDQPGDKYLVAYIVTRDNVDVSVAEWRVFLSSQLPEYMIPSAFVRLDALPLTPNGKVDRRALPAPSHRRLEHDEMRVSPRNETERLIASVWQSVLGLEKVGVHSNFFELGGHSLLLIQVHSQLRKMLTRPPSVVDLFKHPTIAALVRHLSTTTEHPSAALGHVHERAKRQQEAIRRRQELNKPGR